MFKGSKTPTEQLPPGSGHESNYKPHRVPRWVDCDYLEFRNVWLPKFEHGELPPCTDEEWASIKGMLRQSVLSGTEGAR